MKYILILLVLASFNVAAKGASTTVKDVTRCQSSIMLFAMSVKTKVWEKDNELTFMPKTIAVTFTNGMKAYFSYQRIGYCHITRTR